MTLRQVIAIRRVIRYTVNLFYDHLRNRDNLGLKGSYLSTWVYPYIEMDLRNKTTSEFNTAFYSTLGVPNS